MHIEIKGTDLGNNCLVQANFDGTPDQLLTLLMGAMHNDEGFAIIVQDAAIQYMIDCGAMHEE